MPTITVTKEIKKVKKIRHYQRLATPCAVGCDIEFAQGWKNCPICGERIDFVKETLNIDEADK